MKKILNLITRTMGPISTGLQNGITIAVLAALVGITIYVGYKIKKIYQETYYSISFNHPDVINLVSEHALKIDTLERTRLKVDSLLYNIDVLKERFKSDSILHKGATAKRQLLLLEQNRIIAQYRASAPCSLKTVIKKVFGKDEVTITEVPCENIR